MIPKSAGVFLTASVAGHIFFVAALGYPSFLRHLEERNLVEIEYVASPPAPITVQEKKTAGSPAKVMPPHLPDGAFHRRSEANKAGARGARAPASKAARPPAAVSKPLPAIRRSEDILADPAKGKIFTDYFAAIKGRIQQRIQRRYSRENVGAGSVALLFVLDSEGCLESVAVLEKQSTGGRSVKDFAVQCVRDAAPFGRFPSNLGLNKISFNLTVLFQEV